MDEQDIRKKIAESAQDIEIPEEIHPQQVAGKLNNYCKKKRMRYRKAVAAACLCLCFGAGSFAFYYGSHLSGEGSEYQFQITKEADTEDGKLQANQPGTDEDTGSADGGTGNADEDTGSADGGTGNADKAADVPLKKIGNMYTLAGNYGDVYTVLKKTGGSKQNLDRIRGDTEKKEAASDAVSSGGFAEQEDSYIYNGRMADGDYSDTNLQVEGVDESDIVKTDGKYIYVVQDDRIQVLDVQDKLPKEAGVILPDLNEDTDKICEMYVSDQNLTLIIQAEKTSLQEKEAGQSGDVPEDTKKQEDGSKSAMAQADDVYRIDTASITKVQTYDISDPKKAVPKDTITQDGWYQTSRKTGGRLYLFTSQSLCLPDDMTYRKAVQGAAAEEWIPSVNGQAVSADCIYLQKTGNGGLLVSSIDLQNQSRVIDTKLLINHYAQLYVTSTSIYLYDSEYVTETEKTRIARFALAADGTMRAAAAVTVKGRIMDTFAVHERDGYLQVLTSVTSADPWENRVYVLDENMEVAGKLTGLARGEQIYSARFTGAIGYFVTYRNTDPLFTVDFSDPNEPKIIGELKVSGFSEYLHFWSEDLLLGIGYETNPKTGEQVGLKLSMFDISDPVNVKEKGKVVIEDASYCEGMYDYKAVLVSHEKNIIALTTETYRDQYRKDYRVFSYADGKFTSCLECAIAKNGGYDTCSWRSIYVGDMLYLVSGKKTVAFDMKKGWKKIGRVKYGK